MTTSPTRIPSTGLKSIISGRWGCSSHDQGNTSQLQPHQQAKHNSNATLACLSPQLLTRSPPSPARKARVFPPRQPHLQSVHIELALVCYKDPDSRRGCGLCWVRGGSTPSIARNHSPKRRSQVQNHKNNHKIVQTKLIIMHARPHLHTRPARTEKLMVASVTLLRTTHWRKSKTPTPMPPFQQRGSPGRARQS